MTKVSGIGGIFFRAQDQEGLAKWYETHLGVSPVPKGPDDMPWVQEAGPTVFSPFSTGTDYFPAEKQFMINFRVDDLDGLVVELESSGIEITSRETMDGIGRFAHLFDPEGNKIELWEPAT